MKRLLLAFALILATASVAAAKPRPGPPPKPPQPHWAIVIHGGAGVITRGKMDAPTEAAYRKSMSEALAAGETVLKGGGTAQDAVETVIKRLEDDPLFNAGRGAVFTAEGRNELDAAFMDGRTLSAGAVARVTRTRHPISLARTVMAKSKYVFLTGEGADQFAKDNGLEMVDPSFFFTERRWLELTRELNEQHLVIPPRPAGAPQLSELSGVQADDHRFGTVGVVALDTHGDVAAGTSTGGLTAKRWGRVGDSPIIGAGTYASNQSCAVSGTGTGEYFIRLTVAREICALVQYKGMPLQKAADEVIQKRLTAMGGDGGIIAVDPAGHMAWSFNTEGMYRASGAWNQPDRVAIFKDEK
ncbi:MAG: isoaspartyl peptidase/L-asparaginase [Caulobacter sp.]|nr:isoaspartyl peptidase/L-asparaginase [Caulobacter sp.]